jgi:hypothetical protein
MGWGLLRSARNDRETRLHLVTRKAAHIEPILDAIDAPPTGLTTA